MLSAEIPKPQCRTAIRASDGLSVEPAVCDIVILGGTTFAHRESGHRGRRTVVWQLTDDGESRAAVGARHKRMPITSVGGVEQLRYTVVAYGDVGRDGCGRSIGRSTVLDLEWCRIARLHRHRNTGNRAIAARVVHLRAIGGRTPRQRRPDPVPRRTPLTSRCRRIRSAPTQLPPGARTGGIRPLHHADDREASADLFELHQRACTHRARRQITTRLFPESDTAMRSPRSDRPYGQHMVSG